ncbi:hypothetical protein T484DRAFT_1920449 [Baffinella frigidus]|nr:hypothetical protein T484DRAFT_1920449 [Cryptophyta sp. CCMP2293]
MAPREATCVDPFEASPSAAFPPDPRMETDLKTGEIYFVKSVREDGWCLVTKGDMPTEYWAPGNYLSTNGACSNPTGHSLEKPTPPRTLQ